MAKHKAKRYDGVEGSVVTEKRVDLANPGAYKMPMPRKSDAEIEESFSKETEPGSSTPSLSGESAPSKPKARIVSKKELEASGLSLRDFLNKERGLDRKQPANWKKRGFFGSETGGDAAVMYRKSMSKGGVARSSASKRADGCAERGHTKGRNV